MDVTSRGDNHGISRCKRKKKVVKGFLSLLGETTALVGFAPEVRELPQLLEGSLTDDKLLNMIDKDQKNNLRVDRHTDAVSIFTVANTDVVDSLFKLESNI